MERIVFKNFIVSALAICFLLEIASIIYCLFNHDVQNATCSGVLANLMLQVIRMEFEE